MDKQRMEFPQNSLMLGTEATHLEELEMTWLVRCLSSKRKDLNLNPQHLHKSQAQWHVSVILVLTQRMKTDEILGLASQPTSQSNG